MNWTDLDLDALRALAGGWLAGALATLTTPPRLVPQPSQPMPYTP